MRADLKAGLSSGVGLLRVRGSPGAVGLIEQHLLVVDLACAGVSQPGLLEHALRGDMVGFDDSDDVLEAERAEGLPHDLARGLGRQPASPRSWMKVVAQFDLWTVMLEWLQPTVADQSSALAILDGPEAQRGLGLNVLGELSVLSDTLNGDGAGGQRQRAW
jgi:hypothetical protein